MLKRIGRPPGVPQPRPPAAVVLVDLCASVRRDFSYEHGSVQDGLERTLAVVRHARSLCLPVAFITSFRNPEITPPLDAETLRSRTFAKDMVMSAFYNGDFRRFVEGSGFKYLVIGGYARHICVRETMLDALKRGLSVLTTDEILFGKAGQEPWGPLTLTEMKWHSPEFEQFQSVDALLRAMSLRMAPPQFQK